MENYEVLNLLVKHQKDELNALYKHKDSALVADFCAACDLGESDEAKMAALSRIVGLKDDGIVALLKKSGASEEKIAATKAKAYKFVSKFYLSRHEALLNQISNLKLLSPFNTALLEVVHEIGKALTKMQKSWTKRVVDENCAEFKAKFETVGAASEFIKANKLYQTNPDGSVCDRTYGAVMRRKGGDFKFEPYAAAFAQEMKSVLKAFDKGAKKLAKLAKSEEDEAYLDYICKLRAAFGERDNARVIGRWQDAERAWMDARGAIQIGHPLEYYEDAYTHAVALELDVRLAESGGVDEKAIKERTLDTFEQIYAKIGASNENMRSLVHSNVKKTQLYVSNPMIFYGADFEGLFSAQVVPNDEIVSRERGKKIFAFVNYIYESAKARPFMKLPTVIFDLDFLDYGREILFRKPKIWKKVYEISTIGHEFGHILFIDSDTETAMNRGGEFKFIEEYKATTGGLVSFFLHENAAYRMPVFYELIKRAVGLVAWQKVNEVRAYYCEGLIHLSLLFASGALKFENNALKVDFSEEAYERFKIAVLDNYTALGAHYAAKKDASEFLARFAKFENEIYLPTDAQTRAFVEFYYAKYEELANVLDDSGEWEKWQNY